jgi:hypothetical protein
MLIEPFLPNKTHASGPTFTDDRTAIRDRAKKEKKDKWLKYMKTMESEEARSVAMAEINRLSGNPVIEEDGSFIRHRKGETVAGLLKENEKFLRFHDKTRYINHQRGPGEHVDMPYGVMMPGPGGTLVRAGGNAFETHMPDTEEYEAQQEKFWNDYDPEEKRAITPNTYTKVSVERTGSLNNYSIDR